MRFSKYALSLVLALAATSVQAGDYGTIDIAWDNSAPASPRFGAGGGFDWNYSNVTGFPSDWDLSPSIKNGQLYTFCLELAETISTTTRTYEIDRLLNAQTPTGPFGKISGTSASALNLLAVNFFDDAKNGTLDTFLNGALAISFTDETAAGAFQLAVWELGLDHSGVFGGDTDFSLATTSWNTGGANQHLANTDVLAGASYLLSLVDGVGGDDVAAVAGLAALALTRDGTGSDAQDQLIVVAVPEAEALLAWTAVLGAIGVVLYRRSK